METELFALVVLYNKTCAGSATCRALATLQDDVAVLIYDNSTRDYGNRAWCEGKGWEYLGGTGNRGLSAAYNACIDRLKSRNESGYLCLLDDDTALTGEYFTALRKAAAEHPEAGILVPKIYSGGRLLSPCRKVGARARSFADEAALLAAPRETWSAINSGMAVSLRLFDNYRYDERIFLDGVDHRFVEDMRQRGELLTLLDYTCEQAFSGHERPPLSGALNRFSIFARDEAYILRGRKTDFWRVAGRRALKLTAQYRTTAFLKILIMAGNNGR